MLEGGEEPKAVTEPRIIPIAQIDNSPHNPRHAFDDESLQSLAESISRFGVLQPILVRSVPECERYEIVAGEPVGQACGYSGYRRRPR